MLVALTFSGSSLAERMVDAESELDRLRELGSSDMYSSKKMPSLTTDLDSLRQGARVERHIPNARFRVAVFEFEDPDNTGLGGVFSSLIAREVLLRSDLRSLGVLRYYGSLQPSEPHPESYFDKVDLLVASQDASLAIWGLIRIQNDSLIVDVLAQLPEQIVHRNFQWTLKLPQDMGGETLFARVWPTRMQVQRVVLPARSVGHLREMVAAIDVVRAGPSDDAPVIGILPKGSTYSVVANEDGWTQLDVNGEIGWVRRAVQCINACAPLLATADFVGELLRFGDGGPVPTISKDLTRDTAVIVKQLGMLANLRNEVYYPADHYLERWRATDKTGWADSDFGAPYANLLALTTLAAKLHNRDEERSDTARVSQKEVREIATQLAYASQEDPRNRPVLQNLAVLFRVLKDQKRAQLATEIAASISSGAEVPPP
ncbi:MAG: SH3 domain-containing protein [Pseudomarimonas sp.]